MAAASAFLARRTELETQNIALQHFAKLYPPKALQAGQDALLFPNRDTLDSSTPFKKELEEQVFHIQNFIARIEMETVPSSLEDAQALQKRITRSQPTLIETAARIVAFWTDVKGSIPGFDTGVLIISKSHQQEEEWSAIEEVVNDHRQKISTFISLLNVKLKAIRDCICKLDGQGEPKTQVIKKIDSLVQLAQKNSNVQALFTPFAKDFQEIKLVPVRLSTFWKKIILNLTEFKQKIEELDDISALRTTTIESDFSSLCNEWDKLKNNLFD